MHIFYDIEPARFKREFGELVEQLASLWDKKVSMPYFRVVHPHSSIDGLPSFSERYQSYVDDAFCRGMLFAGGVPYGKATSIDVVNTVERAFPKVHFLSYGLTAHPSAALKSRFQEFFFKVKNKDVVDWASIDPGFPEWALSIHLLCQAQELASKTLMPEGLWILNSWPDGRQGLPSLEEAKARIVEEVERLPIQLKMRPDLEPVMDLLEDISDSNGRPKMQSVRSASEVLKAILEAYAN